jgi:hypothetical protein
MNKRDREPCAFCPASANITGEHLWSDWAGKMLGERRYTFTRKELDGSVLTWKQDGLNSKANVVCDDCNNGWMSQLETKTKAVAGDMVCKCTPTILEDRDIATIAAFGFLKAVVADHMHENRPPFYTFEERQLFRRTLAVPSGVQMWLASMPVVHGIFKQMTIYPPQNTPRRFELNVFSYGLGHLVIQVAGCRWKKKAYRRHAAPPVLTQALEWYPHSIPFWPWDGNPVSWPAAGHLGHEDIDTFVQRWTNLERGW